MADCVICFEPVEGPSLRCKNRGCSEVMCSTCVEQYLNICLTDNVIPKCPNRTCGWYYLLSDFRGLDGLGRRDHLEQSYARCCFNELLQAHGDTARKSVEVQNRITQLKTQRLRFVTEQFPAAVAEIARLVMPEKLRRIDKQVEDRLLEQSRESRRVCMNLTCGGSLNQDFRCLSCATTFCRACEKIQGPHHECDPNDVATIQALTAMVHCPQCHLAIERSSGCDHMTCARCGQNFLYSSGEAGGSGSNNASVETSKVSLVSVMHRDALVQLGLLDLMGAIEAIAPALTNEKSLTTVLMEYYRNEGASSSNFEHDLARTFERHILRLHLNQRYHRALHQIEHRIINRTVTAEYLQEILSILKQPL